MAESSLADARLLQLRDGDILVFRSDTHLSQETATRIKEYVESALLPWLKERGIEVKVLVLVDQLQLEVIRHEFQDRPS